MNIETTIEQLQPYLAEIAQGIGQASGWTWEIFVRQQYVDGFIALFFFVISLVLANLSVWLLRKGHKIYEQQKNSWRQKDYTDYYFFGTLLGIICIVGVSVSSVIAIQKFANPEYQALTDIISTVRGGE